MDYRHEYIFDRVKDWELYVSENSDVVLLFSEKDNVALSEDHFFDTNPLMVEIFGFVKVGKV